MFDLSRYWKQCNEIWTVMVIFVIDAFSEKDINSRKVWYTSENIWYKVKMVSIKSVQMETARTKNPIHIKEKAYPLLELILTFSSCQSTNIGSGYNSNLMSTEITRVLHYNGIRMSHTKAWYAHLFVWLKNFRWKLEHITLF